MKPTNSLKDGTHDDKSQKIKKDENGGYKVETADDVISIIGDRPLLWIIGDENDERFYLKNVSARKWILLT